MTRLLTRAAVSSLSLAAVTAISVSTGRNPATAGFAYLLLILGISVYFGVWAGLASSVAATALYNYFFLPPLHTFAISERQNWIALTSFLIASIVSSRLVTKARQQAGAAEARQREVEILSAEREKLLREAAHVDALREADELKTFLLRAVSHDLTTPLTAIAIQIERLRMQIDQPSVLSLLDGVANDARRLRRRIENLLAIARVEARNATPRPEPTPAADLFRAASEHLPLGQRPLAITVEDDCPDVFVDPSLALEILVNVIENAHQASPPGEAIELSARRSNQSVRIEVADRGKGIQLHREPADVTHRGLGLEIARALTMTSGGDLLLMHRNGGGTIAQIDLPAAFLPAAGAEAV